MTPGRRAAAATVLWLACALGAPAQAGRLSEATSPYLLSHVEDAIDWHPWGQEALQLARREKKLIFLSIGYASCYWCHVLARTTFADARVIEILSGFVAGADQGVVIVEQFSDRVVLAAARRREDLVRAW